MSNSLNIPPTMIGEHRPLFYVMVCQRADNQLEVDSGAASTQDSADPRTSAIGDVEVREMALDALEAVWEDLWVPNERVNRGPDVVVTACLADGTMLDDMSK